MLNHEYILVMKFIDREPELAFLEKKYQSATAELIIIYGRRRIGKTHLIHEFLKNKKPALYFLCRLESQVDALRRFNLHLMRTFDDLMLAERPLRDWDAIFDYIAEKAHQRVIIVIDEFPFLIERTPEIVSLLQDHWDSQLHATRVMLILMGSSVSMMEKHTLDYQSPLYGRRTGQWKVGRLHPMYLRQIFPTYSVEELMVTFGCLDTIPGYLVKFDPTVDVWTNIKERILAKGEFLHEEPIILLREELRDPSNYMSILSGIAGGFTTFNEIYQRSGLDKSLLSKYLHVLENLGFVQKLYPVTATIKTRLKGKGRYKISDNFIDFWFHHVHAHQEMLEQQMQDDVLDLIKRDIHHYLGPKFEDFILRSFHALGIFSATTLGKWWHKNVEIDVVALNERENAIFLGECKWRDNVSAPSELNRLIQKARNVEWNKNTRKEVYGIFARSFSKKVDEFEGHPVHCIDLETLAALIEATALKHEKNERKEMWTARWKEKTFKHGNR